MFKILQLHEERDPKSVLKQQSKRAQKRLQKDETRNEEARRAVEARPSPAKRNDEGLGVPEVGNHSERLAALTELAHAALLDSNADPTLLDDLRVEIAAIERMRLRANGDGSGPCAQTQTQHHGRTSAFSPFGLPPGPGPGQGGSPRAVCNQRTSWDEPKLSAVETSGGNSSSAYGNGGGLGLGSSLASCGSGGFGDIHADYAGGSGGLGGSRCTPSPSPCASGRSPFSALRNASSGPLGSGCGGFEEFPDLPTPSPPPPPHPAALRGPYSGGSGSLSAARGNSRNARKSGTGGVKVLRSAQSNPHPQHSCNSSGSGQATCYGNSNRSRLDYDDDGEGPLHLDLLCDLLDTGASLLADPLAQGDCCLEGPGPDASAAVRRLLAAQQDGDGPARGVSQEQMHEMMRRAHSRQQRASNAAATGSGAATPGTGEGGEAGSAGSSEDGEEDDDAGLYYSISEGPKSWRHTVEWMKKNGWVLVKDTVGKHYKYRRVLPNNQVQTQTVPCSSSDKLRGVRNLQADLARKDGEANVVIRAWRKEQRQQRRAVAAAAAAAAAAQED